ncbi:MAG TPA: hypothetical protein VMW35_16460 [Myxococcota bacterium]|jgi:hypothetical protein|nr:hypothetical protein [Myxococcota bacterium]
MRAIRFIRSAGAGLGLAAAVSLFAAPSLAQTASDPESAGMGAAAALATLVYAPVKLAWATTGGVVGGLAYVFTGGNADVAIPILESSVYGDYYLTPSQLRGDEPIEFIGRTSADAPHVASDGIPLAGDRAASADEAGSESGY